MPVATPEVPEAARLPTLDRYLAVWIGLAMAAGLLLGRVVPGLGEALGTVEIDGISLPIAIGLLVMMYPVLAKVRYDRLDTVTADRRLLGSSLVLNWLVGPALMFALAWLLLPDLPEYRTGLVIVGLARCIAMVIIWNDLACGDRDAAAVLVAINSLFQVLAFAALGWFYLSVLPGWLGLPQTEFEVSAWQIAKSVLIFLGIPLLVGYLTGRLLQMSYARTTTLAFTAAGNNFELAIAVAIATFGATSGQALAGVVGPLIEVPVLVGLVYVSLALRRRFPHRSPDVSSRVLSQEPR